MYQNEFALRSVKPKAALKDVINKKTDNVNDTEVKAKRYIQKNYNTALQIYNDRSKGQDKSLAGCAFTIPEIRVTRAGVYKTLCPPTFACPQIWPNLQCRNSTKIFGLCSNV